MSQGEEKLHAFLDLKTPESKEDDSTDEEVLPWSDAHPPPVTEDVLPQCSVHMERQLTGGVRQSEDSNEGVNQIVTIGHKQEDPLLH